MIIRIFKEHDDASYSAVIVGYWHSSTENELRTGDGELLQGRTYVDLLSRLENALDGYEGHEREVTVVPMKLELSEELHYATERALTFVLEKLSLERTVEDAGEKLEKLSSHLEDDLRKVRGY